MPGVASGSLRHFPFPPVSMPIALARRYRPKRFADLLVQDHVTAVLRGAIARNRVGHGYLLTGPRGVGKTTAARILAMALNCPNRDASGEPCGECENCLRVWNGSANLDVVEIDAASNRGVDDARELRERAMYAASQEGHHKVYIVDEAHMLTREAWNALLKILEEPPPGVVFVFATTEPQKIASTAAPVLSRLQRFDFRRIGPAAIRDRLAEVLRTEGIAADDDALTLIARHADGGMRDALSVLDQCLSFGEGAITAERVREILGLVADELYAELLDLVVERRPAGVFSLVDRLLDSGADLAEFLGGAADLLRALLMVQLGAEPEGITEAARQAIERVRGALEPGDVLRMLRLLAEAEGAVRRSANVRLAVETLLLRWTMMDRTVDLQQVLSGELPVPAAGATTRPARSPAAGAAPAAAPDRRAAERRAAGPEQEEPAERSPSGPTEDSVPFTPAGVAAAWTDLVAAVRQRSPMVGAVLAGTSPTRVDAPELEVSPKDPAAYPEPLVQQRAMVEEILSARLGGPVHLRVAVAGKTGAPQGEPPRKARLTPATLKAERLEGLRARDPSLDAAADELDLEIID